MFNLGVFLQLKYIATPSNTFWGALFFYSFTFTFFFAATLAFGLWLYLHISFDIFCSQWELVIFRPYFFDQGMDKINSTNFQTTWREAPPWDKVISSSYHFKNSNKLFEICFIIPCVYIELKPLTLENEWNNREFNFTVIYTVRWKSLFHIFDCSIIIRRDTTFLYEGSPNLCNQTEHQKISSHIGLHLEPYHNLNYIVIDVRSDRYIIDTIWLSTCGTCGPFNCSIAMFRSCQYWPFQPRKKTQAAYVPC